MKHFLTDIGLLLVALTALLAIIRLSLIADIPWLWVVAPIWLPCGLALLIFIAIYLHFKLARKRS